MNDVLQQKSSADINAEADSIIKFYSMGAAPVGALPLPLIDLALLTVLQAKMVMKLCNLFQFPCSKQQVKIWISSIVGASSAFYLGPRLFGSLFKMVPGVGSVSGALSTATAASGTTYALGRLFQNHFAQGGSPSSVDPKQMKSDLEKTLSNAPSKTEVTPDVQSDVEEIADVPSPINEVIAVDGQADVNEAITSRSSIIPADSVDPIDSSENESLVKPKVEEVPDKVEEVPDKVEEVPDNKLTVIEGIGPKIRDALNDAGIHTFSDLAGTEVVRLQEVLDLSGNRFRLSNPDSWPVQAELARDGDWEGLKKYLTDRSE